MLREFKRPEQYLNHGVWIVDHAGKFMTVIHKHKIMDIRISYRQQDARIVTKVENIYLENGEQYLPGDVYMTKREAVMSLGKKAEELLQQADRTNGMARNYLRRATKLVNQAERARKVYDKWK